MLSGGTGILPVTKTDEHGPDAHATQRLVILGDPGSGKSSLLRFLALRWARIDDANLRYTQPLPLLIELREYNRLQCSGGKSFQKYLHEASTWHRLNQQTLNHLLQQPDRVILLLDGLDEVFEPAERERVVNDIHRLSNDCPRVSIILTSRVVGYQPHRLRSADFRHFMLQDLDQPQIGDFLNKWHAITFEKPEEGQAKRQRLDIAIKNSKSIALLAGNPLLLTMMAILNRHQELPRARVDLYQQCSRLLLHQWDVERTLGNFPGLSAEIGLREKTDILRSVAYAMQTRLSDKSRANYIDGTTLSSLIEDYLHTELRFEQARAVSRALVEQLRIRNFILCHLGADSYAFVHRTFLEYFCAADIVHQFNVAKTLSEGELLALFDAHYQDDDWREVLRLICGQIDEQFVSRIVEHLAMRTNLDEWDGGSVLPEWPLAIWCLSEARNISRCEPIGRQLLLKLMQIARRSADFASAFLMLQLLPACRELGERWPGRELLKEYEHSLLGGVQRHGYGNTFWIHLLAHVSASRAAIESFSILKTVDRQGASGRAAAIRALAERWPDAATRERLVEHGIQDENSDVRRSAFEVLGQKWPDAMTHHLLVHKGLQDKEGSVRSDVLRVLAQGWLDETTRQLVTQRAVQDESSDVRYVAASLLSEKWPDEITREVLMRLAVEDGWSNVRWLALSKLAGGWPNEVVRDLLSRQAAADGDQYVRYETLAILIEKWPDETSRKVLSQRAKHDGSELIRRMASQLLAKKWPMEGANQNMEQGSSGIDTKS